MAQVTALSCPLCGSPLEVESGSRLAQCRSCQASVALGAETGFYRYYVEPKIRRNAALSLAGQTTELPFEAIAAQLIFVPVWQVEAEVFGFVGGQRPVLEKVITTPEDDRGRTREVRLKTGGEVMKKTLWLSKDFRKLGVRWGELGSGGIKQKATEVALVPEDRAELSRMGLVLEPDAASEREVMERSARYFRGQLLFPYQGYLNLISRISLLRQRRRLIYYPAWRVLGFTPRGRQYCLVDGVDGSRVSANSFGRPKISPPTKYLALTLAGALALSMALAPPELKGQGWAGLLAPFLLAGLVLGSSALSRAVLERLADRVAWLIWRV